MALFIIIFSQNQLKNLIIKKYRLGLISTGLALTLNWLLFFYAVKLTTIANAVLLTYTAPIFVALMAPIFLKEKLERATVISLIIAAVGIILIVSPHKLSLAATSSIGLLCALGSAITYAILVIASKFLVKHFHIAIYMFYQSLITTILLFPAALDSTLHIEAAAWLILLVLGVIHTALAPGLYLSGLREVKAQQAGVLTYFDPLSAIILATIFLGEYPTIATIFGGILIIMAGCNIILRRPVKAEIIPE